jgi:hypothetical protein
VKLVPGKPLAVRSTPTGIEVFELAADGTPSLLGTADGVASSAVNTDVAIDPAGTRAVRAHPSGIEIYDLTNPASPQRVAQRSGGASTTGVSLFLAGNFAFRATNVALEAYDLRDSSAPQSIGATPSSIGVALTGTWSGTFPQNEGPRLD